MRKLTYIAALLVALVATGYAVADGNGGREDCDRGRRNVRGHRHEHIEPHVHDDRRQDDRRHGRQVHRTRGGRSRPDRRDHAARAQRHQHDRQRRRRQRQAQDRTGIRPRHRGGVLRGLRPRRDRGPRERPRARPVRTAGRQPVGHVLGRNRVHGGKLGGGTSGGSAVEVGAGSCKPSHTTPEKSEAHGTISALSTTSITVAGLTCAIPADKSADVNAKFKQNDVAQIRCSLVSGVNTLTSISGKHR